MCLRTDRIFFFRSRRNNKACLAQLFYFTSEEPEQPSGSAAFPYKEARELPRACACLANPGPCCSFLGLSIRFPLKEL